MGSCWQMSYAEKGLKRGNIICKTSTKAPLLSFATVCKPISRRRGSRHLIKECNTGWWLRTTRGRTAATSCRRCWCVGLRSDASRRRPSTPCRSTPQRPSCGMRTRSPTCTTQASVPFVAGEEPGRHVHMAGDWQTARPLQGGLVESGPGMEEFRHCCLQLGACHSVQRAM